MRANNLCSLMLMAICSLTACVKEPSAFPKPDRNMQYFKEPITCVTGSANSANKLYLGFLDNGEVIEWGNRDTFYVGSKRTVYDVVEMGRDSLWIGTSDGGLILLDKITQKKVSFPISGKENKYSAYSLAMDYSHGCLYVGTSNGLFYLPFQHETSVASLSLIPICADSLSRINKVLCVEGKLYVACNKGLYIGDGAQVNVKQPLIRSAVNNLSICNDTVYAMLDNCIKQVTGHRQVTLTREGLYKWYVPGIRQSNWLVGPNEVVYEDGEDILCDPLPDEISSKAKHIGYKGNDYLHIADGKVLLSYPLKQNESSENFICTVSKKRVDEDNIYFLTRDHCLHAYCFEYGRANNQSVSLGRIEGLEGLDNGTAKLVEINRKTFYLADHKRLYKIEGNQARCLHVFNEEINTLYYSNVEKQLYVGTRYYLALFDEQSSKSVVPIPLYSYSQEPDTTDAYVNDIYESEEGFFVSSLTKGLFARVLNRPQDSLKLVVSRPTDDSVEGVVADGKDLYLYTSNGRTVNEKWEQMLDHTDIRFMAGVWHPNPNEGFFIFRNQGVSFMERNGETSLKPIPHDFVIKKNCVSINGKKAVLGGNQGLFLFDGKTFLPIRIDKHSGRNNNVTWGMIGVGTVVVSLLSVMVIKRIKRRQSNQKDVDNDFLPDQMINLDNEKKDERSLMNIEDKIKQDLQTITQCAIELRDKKEGSNANLESACIEFLKNEEYSELMNLSSVGEFKTDLKRLQHIKKNTCEYRRYIGTFLFMIDCLTQRDVADILGKGSYDKVRQDKHRLKIAIESLTESSVKDAPIIRFLYRRIGSGKEE